MVDKSLILLSWWKQQENDAYAITFAEAEANRICRQYDGYSARFLPAKTTGIGGDDRLYGFVIELAGCYDAERLAVLSNRITNEVRGINRVVFSINGYHS